ncbi:MAG: Rpn family recombination-promoting nuclease/putative transposase [Caldilineaceae bacterium]|nr:Rpn family recombination-promoting nuclease/putative transposase [Caldilineaceae bacterium]
MSKLVNPHDRFFRFLLSRPESATDLLRYHLPPAITSLIDLTIAPKVMKDSFVDQALEAHFSDLLYHIVLKSGDPAYVYTLFDHKSYIDGNVPLQLLRYKVQIWEQLPRQAEQAITPVIPIVFYHGLSKWSKPTNFAGLYPTTTDDTLLPFLVDYQYHLIDLSQYSDDELKGEVRLRAGLLLFKYILRPDLRDKLPAIFGLIRRLTEQETGLEYLETMLRYLSHGARHLSMDELREAVEQVLEEDEPMATIAETLMEQGRREGEIKGRREGEIEGRREGEIKGRRENILESIEILLELKFGVAGLALLSEIQEIDNINMLQLIQRSMRIVTTVDEVRALYQSSQP